MELKAACEDKAANASHGAGPRAGELPPNGNHAVASLPRRQAMASQPKATAQFYAHICA